MRECRFCHRRARSESYSCGICWVSTGRAEVDLDYEPLVCLHGADLNGRTCPACDAALIATIS